MTQEQFTKGITYLGVAYNKGIPQEQISVWYDFFQDTDYDIFRQAVKRIIPKKQFMPSIAEIKQEIALIENPLLQLDIDSEWDEAINTIRKFGRYKQEEIMNNLKSYTADIIRQIGIERICNSTDITWERKQFYDLFNNSQSNYEKMAVIGPSKYTLGELTSLAKMKSLEMDKDKQLLIE